MQEMTLMGIWSKIQEYIEEKRIESKRVIRRRLSDMFGLYGEHCDNCRSTKCDCYRSELNDYNQTWVFEFICTECGNVFLITISKVKYNEKKKQRYFAYLDFLNSKSDRLQAAVLKIKTAYEITEKMKLY